MHAAVYFNFNFRDEGQPVTEGVISSVNFPGETAHYDEQRGQTQFRLISDRPFVGYGLFICPHYAIREYSPEVITHIGSSKIVVIAGDKEVWDFPPGAVSMQTEGRMKPAVQAIILPRGEMKIEWRIIDNDMPPPIIFTVGFEGILKRDVQ